MFLATGNYKLWAKDLVGNVASVEFSITNIISLELATITLDKTEGIKQC